MLNDEVSGVRTFGTMWMRQTWCMIPLHPAISQFSFEYKLFHKHCGPYFRWLLAVCSQMFLRTLLQWPLSSPRPASHTSSSHVAAELFAPGFSNCCFGSPHSHHRQNEMTFFWYVSRWQETVAQGLFICAPGNSRGNLNIARQTCCSVWYDVFMAVTMDVLFTLPVEVDGYCVTWMIFYQSTRRHIPKDINRQDCDTVVANAHKYSNHFSSILHVCLSVCRVTFGCYDCSEFPNA
jgi:hypothetical protein